MIIITLSYVNVLFPKKKRVLFYNDSIRDNNKYLMEYLAANYKLEIWCYYFHGNEDNKIEKGRIQYITKLYELIYLFLTSKVIITSFDHRYIIKPTNNQIIIQLWHGYALKNIGNDFCKQKWDKRGTYYTDILCYSDLWKESISKAFGANINQLKIWDNPRNDLLYKSLTKKQIESIIGISFDKLILWMPTYRKSHKLHDSEDSSNDIPIINSKNIDTINESLIEKNMILVIKPHPLQNSLKEIVKNKTNIVLINNEIIEKAGYELYQFVAASDVLITDYSSIYFDYLIVDKPIGFAYDDMEEYKQKRGFAFDDVRNLMPGVHIHDVNDFLKFLDNPNCNDVYYSKERKRIRKLVSRWNDNKNSKRIADYIALKCEE